MREFFSKPTAARRRLVAGLGYPALYLAYRSAYQAMAPKRSREVTAEFTLDMPLDEAYDLLRNPRNLDATTPSWFGIRIRNDASEAAVDAYLARTRPGAGAAAENPTTEQSVHIDYWCFLFGVVPFPWTSEVTKCGPCNAPVGRTRGYEVCIQVVFFYQRMGQ